VPLEAMTPRFRVQLLLRHADAVVGDGQGAGVLVHADADEEILPVHADALIGQRAVAQLVDGVRGVGEDLAQEDLLVRIDRIDHQVEHPFGLGLELLFCH